MDTSTRLTITEGAMLSFGRHHQTALSVQPAAGPIVIEGPSGSGRSTLLSTFTAEALHLPGITLAAIAGPQEFAVPWLRPWADGATRRSPIEWVADTDDESRRLLDTLLAIVANHRDPAGPDVLLLVNDATDLSEEATAKLITLCLIGRAARIYPVIGSTVPRHQLTKLAAGYITLAEQGAGHLTTPNADRYPFTSDQRTAREIATQAGTEHDVATLEPEATATAIGRQHFPTRWARTRARLFPGTPGTSDAR